MVRRTRSERPDTLSRRRFVALVAAGSAAFLAPEAPAAPAARRAPKPSAPAVPPARPTALQAELDRQRASTLEALKTIRAHALPVGAESASIFRPIRRTRGR